MKFHFVKMEIASRYLYRLLNNTGNIRLHKIKIGDETATFMVDARDLREVEDILKSLNVPLVRLEHTGVYPRVAKFSVLKIVTGVLMIFMILLLVNALFIWEISVDGNYSYTDSQVVSFIHEQNIREGDLKNEINCDALERSIRKEFPDISWVCAEIKGTNLMIHIKENYITDISTVEEKPYNLVANRNGKIVSALVRKGKLMVKVGERVKKGDVIISGAVDVLDEAGEILFQQYCNADGNIVAETKYTYKDSIALTHPVKVHMKENHLTLPSIFRYQWLTPECKEGRDIICKESGVRFFGEYYLPVTIQSYTIRNYEIKEVEYTKEEAEMLLNDRMLNKLAVLEQKGYKIMKKNVKIEKIGNFYQMEGEILCQEPFGSVSYLDIQEHEEASTTVYERN